MAMRPWTNKRCVRPFMQLPSPAGGSLQPPVFHLEALKDQGVRASSPLNPRKLRPGWPHSLGRQRPRTHHSHSMLAGGFVLMSYSTRFTPFTLLRILLDVLRSTSYGSSTQSAVIASSLMTARREMACS